MSRRVVRGFDPDRFRRYRADAGLSRADLARAANVSVGAIRYWEVGEGTPQVDTLARAAAALGLRMTDLVKVEESDVLLSDLRVFVGLTQPQLAARAGISTSTLAGLEQGHLRLVAEQAAAIARALSVPESVVVEAYERGRAR